MASLQIKQLTPSEYASWDDYVQSHSHASPYHRTAWKEAVEQAYGHKTFYFMAMQDGRLAGVLPLVHVKSPFSKGTLCSLPFCDVGGVLSDSPMVQDALLREAKNLGVSLGGVEVEIRAREQDAEAGDEGKDTLAGKVSMLMPLPETSEELWSSFKSKLRSQVRKAEKNGLTFRLAQNAEDMDLFYDVISHNMRALGSPVHSFQWYKSIYETFDDNTVVGLVFLEEKVVGAGLLIFNGAQVAIPWASTKAEFNRYAPNMLLYWNLIEAACNKGAKEFDFGRSTFGEGTFKFKSQWGAKPVKLNWVSLSSDEKIAESEGGVSALRALIEKVWRNLPLSIVNFVGPKVRKYISL